MRAIECNRLSLKFLFLLSVVLSFVTFSSCQDTETIDETEFAIYYLGMTDIGPSMVGVISSPSYIGAEPSNFEITEVTVDDKPYSGTGFAIDESTGVIYISETSEMPVGLYKLSVRCSSNGRTYDFANVVEVNMMEPVPEGISIEPRVLVADYADVINPDGEFELPTARVITEGNHITITKYSIVNSDLADFFEISSTGVISIVRGNAELSPGKYVLSLKLTTGATGEDEGIFENAVEINITSKPLLVEYAPATGKLEEESVKSGSTTFASNIPMFKGSLEGIEFSLKSVSPLTDKINIDPQTGVIYVDEEHGLTSGNTYLIDINVKNEFAKEGVSFDGVFALEVVEFIEPIKNFSYADVRATQAVEFAVSPDAEFVGDEVKFELLDLPAQLEGNVEIDIHGAVTARKGNTIPLGEYQVKVKAINSKSDDENPTIATFTLTVSANPNYFTYLRYGNNLGLAPASNYASQFRIGDGVSESDVSPTPETDASEELEYELRIIHQMSGTTIDSKTGVISILGTKANNGGIVMVTATAGKGTPEEYSVTAPVFFCQTNRITSTADNLSDVLLEYTPFVFRVNPIKGGRSVEPTIENVDLSLLTMDYRRTFNYYNFFGTHKDGQPKDSGSFMSSLWDNYAETTGTTPNYGSKNPVSYFVNSENVGNALLYVDQDTKQVVVNPNKWIAEGEPANGAMIGQITLNGNGADPSGAKTNARVFPIILWFDTKF